MSACPWCGKPLPAEETETCPECGARLRPMGEPHVAGVTDVAPSTEGGTPAARALGATTESGEADPAFQPPSPEVLEEMARLEQDAEPELVEAPELPPSSADSGEQAPGSSTPLQG